jgi:hypothetical protein
VPGLQNSRHGEKIHTIATGREHRCSGWAALHRRRSTACRLINRVVNADAGNQFIAPSSQHPLHLERPRGAETVARQQPWSNSAPPMSGVLDSPVAPSSTWIRGSSPKSGPSSTAGMAAQWLPGSLVEPRRRLWLALKPSRGRVGPMTQQSGWHENPQDRSRLRCRDAVIWSSDVTPKVSPTVDRSDRAIPCGVAPAGPGAAERPVASIRRRP